MRYQLLYGTNNVGKIHYMQTCVQGLNIDILSLSAMPFPAPEVLETGNTPLENAKLKAWAYWRTYHTPCFSCDSGLYFVGLPDALQPGVHTRRVHGISLNDEEMIVHYGMLANCILP